MRYWEYQARMFSRDGEHVFTVLRIVDDAQYSDPYGRQVAEEFAQDELRAVEGWKPDIEIESLGWRERDL